MSFSTFFNRLSDYNRKNISFYSQLLHLFSFRIEKPRMILHNGMLIISIDIDVGNRKLGLLNGGQNDLNVHNNLSEYQIGEIEEEVIPLFVKLLDDFEIPVTFAVRGQLSEVYSSSKEILQSLSSKHEIGAHGYYHKDFTKLSRGEAENELKLISSAMKKWGINQRSFIFPKNQIAHLDLLPKYGYECYRGLGGFPTDCMYIEKSGELYNVHPSLYIDQYTNHRFLTKLLDISTSKKLPLHLWFHIWNFGKTKNSINKRINKIFFPFFEYAKKKENEGLLTFETMYSATLKIKKQSGSQNHNPSPSIKR